DLALAREEPVPEHAPELARVGVFSEDTVAIEEHLADLLGFAHEEEIAPHHGHLDDPPEALPMLEGAERVHREAGHVEDGARRRARQVTHLDRHRRASIGAARRLSASIHHSARSSRSDSSALSQRWPSQTSIPSIA